MLDRSLQASYAMLPTFYSTSIGRVHQDVSSQSLNLRTMKVIFSKRAVVVTEIPSHEKQEVCLVQEASRISSVFQRTMKPERISFRDGQGRAVEDQPRRQVREEHCRFSFCAVPFEYAD